ncbi:MAG: HD-GYP domain-containing protein [Planctomycetota bacterium]|nr:HD-GYP domain-containing protein [Planctomycetota bacterium]
MSPDIVEALVKTIELKDQSTAAHTWRVVLYARALAERAGMKPEFIARLTTGAALHDVGKIDIPDNILQKPGKLTDEEFEVIKSHTVVGHERLRRMGEDDPILLDLVRHHHERVDGKGYPDGLRGDQIPVVARYFAVIDTFDALTSVRPYRREVGIEAAEKAIIELKNGVETRYDPAAVEIFVDLYRQGELDWILSYFNDGSDVPAVTELASTPGKTAPDKIKV